MQNLRRSRSEGSVGVVPLVTFGIIVLNGEPFLRYNLRALYPFAHQIIVVEGAAPAAAAIATPEGHSTDGTLETLRDFQANEDPNDKLVVVTAEDEGHPDGFWPGEKDEMSQAYAHRATGDWLWQVDADEFYQPYDIEWICQELLSDPGVHAVSFRQIQFWGGLNSWVDGWFLRYHLPEIHRIFRWGPGHRYTSHRPPTVVDANGVDLRRIGHVSARKLARRGVFLYHYSLVLPRQVAQKSAYYSQADWGSFGQMREWASNQYEKLTDPYRVHNVYRYPSWLESYVGSHPPQIETMWRELQNDATGSVCRLRRTDDIQGLLRSPRYRIGKALLKLAGHFVCGGRMLALRAFRRLPEPVQCLVKSMVTTRV